MLRNWLQKNSVSHSRLADELGVSRGYVSGLVNGNKKPSIEMAMRISLFTGGVVSLRSWFTDAEIARLEQTMPSGQMKEAG